MKLLKLSIEELHCSSCVATVDNLFSDLVKDGVLKVTTIVANRSVKINYDEAKIKPEAIFNLLENAGLEYEIIN